MLKLNKTKRKYKKRSIQEKQKNSDKKKQEMVDIELTVETRTCQNIKRSFQCDMNVKYILNQTNFRSATS